MEKILRVNPMDACMRKRSFDIKVKAEVAALGEMNRLRGKKAPPLSVYNCPVCEKWHLTKKKR